MGVIKKAMTSLTTSEEGVDLDYKQESSNQTILGLLHVGRRIYGRVCDFLEYKNWRI